MMRNAKQHSHTAMNPNHPDVLCYELMSDLHMSQNWSSGKPNPDDMPAPDYVAVSILAGDLDTGLRESITAMERIQRAGRTIFAVDGNHEHYANAENGMNLNQTEAIFRNAAGGSIREIAPGLTLIGCNGWFMVDRLQAKWTDTRRGATIGTANEVTQKAIEQARWLDDELKKIEGKALVVTHTLPAESLVRRQWEGHPGNDLVFNPMMDRVALRHRKKILAWHCGHTHTRFLDRLHGIPVICNPRGFAHENGDWAPVRCGVNLNTMTWMGVQAGSGFSEP